MKLIADLHTHTVASGHAYGTLSEMVRAAADLGLAAIGITDHGPAMPAGAHQYYFSNMATLPESMFGVRVLRGVEANIINTEGELDIWPGIQAEMDYIIASMHIRGVSPEGLSREENTQMWIRALQNPHVKMLGHPENPAFPIDVARLVSAVKAAGKVIEVNTASFIVRHGSEPVMREIVRQAVAQSVPLAVTSDAHFTNRLADFSPGLALLADCQVPESLVINTSMDKIEEYLL